MQPINDKTKERYLVLANEVMSAQRRLQEFLTGVALALDVDLGTHNFDTASMGFVPKPLPVAAQEPQQAAQDHGANGASA